MNIVEIVVSGLVGTVFIDLWQQGLRLMAGLPASNWGLVGRWFVAAGGGRFFHDSIAKAPAHPNEGAIGWVGPYAVGILYGPLYVVLMRASLCLSPPLRKRLFFSLFSRVVPRLF